MLVKQAREAARQWVFEDAVGIPGFYGALFLGSTNWMPAEGPLPLTSDVDVKIILEGTQPPAGNFKFPYRGIVLDVSYTSSDQFQSSDDILADISMATQFTGPNVILDPSGQLTMMSKTVSRDYARRKWVQNRYENARNWLLLSLGFLNPSGPFPDQVSAWLYATSQLSHLILVADLQNTTVRRCLIASREVLAKYHHLSLHETILDILGSAGLYPEEVASLLASCTEVFDVSMGLYKTPFMGSSMITDFARPLAIEGSKELIQEGYHREAVFWIAVTHTRCQQVIENDGSAETRAMLTPRYYDLLGKLGVKSTSDLRDRIDRIRELLPRLGQVSSDIIASNSEITE